MAPFCTHSITLNTPLPLIVVIFMGIAERIKEIEDEMARTQKNKATEFHMGQLKAKLAKLRTQLLEPAGKGGKTG